MLPGACNTAGTTVVPVTPRFTCGKHHLPQFVCPPPARQQGRLQAAPAVPTLPRTACPCARRTRCVATSYGRSCRSCWRRWAACWRRKHRCAAWAQWFGWGAVTAAAFYRQTSAGGGKAGCIHIRGVRACVAATARLWCHALVPCRVSPPSQAFHARRAPGQASKPASAGRAHQVWAVRSNVDPFLDLARATFNRLTGAHGGGRQGPLAPPPSERAHAQRGTRAPAAPSAGSEGACQLRRTVHPHVGHAPSGLTPPLPNASAWSRPALPLPPTLEESIQELANAHRASDPDLAGLKAKYTHAKGWHFVLPQVKPHTRRGAAAAASARAHVPK